MACSAVLSLTAEDTPGKPGVSGAVPARGHVTTGRWPSEARSLDWGVFFDSDFSPLDGNDWVDSGAVPVGDNGDGTFTLKKSYLDEAALKRSPEGMPYNDLDLYTMGLYICKYIIELPGGEIKVKSEPGRGTTFSLTLPVFEEPSQVGLPSGGYTTG